jgi:hypothetical protein
MMKAVEWSLLVALALTSVVRPSELEAQQRFDRLSDRGPGVPTSMFGTYIERHQLLFYPYYEFYLDNNAEYSPNELGFGLDQDFRGRYRAHEWLIFLGYGISDRLEVELEGAVITAQQDKAAGDPSSMPLRLEESGLGDVESQLRWRWSRESESGPELFSWFETVFPFQRHRRLIGTQDWEFQLGTGLVRGFRWGTTTLRLALEYEAAEKSLALGEFAVEYLKRISPRLRVFGAIEGTGDEVELITEAQLFLQPNIFLKLNQAVGLTSKATDWAPEIGVMFSFP